MNCSRFRFLIQQKFDLDLAPQEERIVLAHLESCESCAKFYHQLQQVILAAEEAPLPDEILPASEEQLARMIMSQLPVAKSSPFAFFTDLFKKKEKAPQDDFRSDSLRGPKKSSASSKGTSGSAFPHRSSAVSNSQGASSPAASTDKEAKYKGAKSEEYSGASSRLKAMNKGFDPEAEQRELQSRTLGEKFGMPQPVASGVDNAPLTLAESIRRKISEGARPSGEMGQDPSMPADPTNGESDNFGNQYNEQYDQQGQPGQYDQNDQGTDNQYDDQYNQFDNNVNQPPMPQGVNQAAMPQVADFGSLPAAPAGFNQMANNAPGPAPVVGSWGRPSSLDGGWNGTAAGGNQPPSPMQQALPPQPYLAEQPAAFNAAANQPQPQMHQQQAAPQPTGWGTNWDNTAGAQPAGNNWNQPSSQAQPPAAQAIQPQASPPAWGAPAQAASNNPAPSFDATPTAASAAQPAPAWAPAPQPAPVQPPVSPNQPNAWGSGAGGDSWDAAGGQRGWGQTAAEASRQPVPAPAPQPQAPAPDAWSQPVSQPAWGQTAGAVVDASSQAANQFAPSNSAPAADTAQQGANDNAQNNWGASKPQGAWGTPTDANDWKAPAAQIDSQMDTLPVVHAVPPPQAPAPVVSSPPPAPSRPPARPAWSLESEQIETGTWQAFSPSGETLGAKSTPVAAKKIEPETSQGDPLSIDERWSTPIQSRQQVPAAPQPVPQQGFAPPMMPPPMPSAVPFGASTQTESQNAPAAPSGLAYPNYSPDALKEAEPAWAGQAPAEAAPAAPQPPVVQPPSLQQSVMAKLNNTLSETAKPGSQPDSWELSIQEKLQAQHRALQGASMQQLAAMPMPAAPQEVPSSPQSGGWNAQAGQASDWSSSQPVVPQAQNLWGGAQSQSGAQNIQPVPQTQMPQAFQPPAQPQQPAQPEQKSSLFSLDDGAIDKLFNENLGLKGGPAAESTPARASSAAGIAPATGYQAPRQSPQQPTAPQQPQTQGWSAQPTTWAPEPQQAPPPVAQAPAQQQFQAPPVQEVSQPQYNQAPPQNAGWSDPNQTGGPRISSIAPRTNGQTMPGGFAPGEDRRNPPQQSGQFAPPQYAPQTPAAQPAEVAPQQAPQNAAQKQQGLFNLDDNAMDQLFQKNLGVEESVNAVGGNGQSSQAPQQMTQAPQPVQQVPQQQQQQQAAVPTGNWAPPAPASPQQGGWANPAQNQQVSGGFSSPNQPPVPQAPQQMQQPSSQPAPNQGWAQPPQQQQAPQPQPPSQAGWGQAGNAGWGQQQQAAGPGQPPVTPTPRIGGGSGEPGKPRTGLFAIDDSVIDSIFADNLGVRDGQQMPKFNVNEAVNKLSEAAGQQPAADTYGGNSYDSPAPVKVEGVGRLDTRVDNTPDQNSGRIASIGKFLLDQKDLEKIGNITEADLSDSSMRVLTTEAASELQQLLQHIGAQKSVIGSVIIGHDGLLIANTLPPDFDAESMGQFALGIYMNTSTAVTRLGHDHVHQFVGRTPRGYIVIADFGGGLLVTISEGSETDALIPLMRSITQLVVQ